MRILVRMLITIGVFLTLTFFSGLVGGLVNMSKSLSPNNPQNQINQQNYENTKGSNSIITIYIMDFLEMLLRQSRHHR